MARTVKSYAHMELGPIGVRGMPIHMRMEPKHGNYFRASQHLTKAEQQQWMARDEDLRKKYKERPLRHSDGTY